MAPAAPDARTATGSTPTISSSDAVLIDANLLIWAHHRQFPHHEQARRWLAQTLSATPIVGIPWPSMLAFLRISSHPRALERPLAVETAWEVANGWLARPNVRIPVPTERHRDVFDRMLLGGRATADHTTDAHLAALAIEWGMELQSADRDFARYPGLRWVDPLASVA